MERGWAGVDAVLVNDLTVPEEILRSDGPAQLPAGDGEGFSGAADRDRPIPHVGQRRHPDHLAALENLKQIRKFCQMQFFLFLL